MELFAESRKELRAYFTSALGLAAQSYDPRGQGSDSDLSGTMWTRIADERRLKAVREHVATERTLYSVPTEPREILRAWGSPRRSPVSVKERRGKDTVIVYPVVEALGELAFVAPYTHQARELMEAPTQEAIALLSKPKRLSLREPAKLLLEWCLGVYEERRLARVDAERAEAAQAKARRDAALEATRARVKRASSRPAIFTEEEADTIRRLVSGL